MSSMGTVEYHTKEYIVDHSYCQGHQWELGNCPGLSEDNISQAYLVRKSSPGAGADSNSGPLGLKSDVVTNTPP